MLSARSLVRGLVLLAAMGWAANALAQSEALRKAIDLYDSQEYVASQEALLKVDRATLTDDEKKVLDEYLNRADEAIKGAERARQDMQAADAAYRGGQWDEAEKLYRAVAANKFTQTSMVDAANRQIASIDEKRALQRAVEPRGTNGPQPAAQEGERVRVTIEEEPAPVVVQQEPVVIQEGPPPTRMTVVEEMLRRDELLWERAVSRSQEMITQARDAAARNDYGAARGSIQNAEQIIEEARIYADPPSKYEAQKALIRQVRDEIADREREFTMEEARRQREEIAIQLRIRREEQERKRREQIEQLFESARRLRKEQRYREAAEMIRQVQILDPGNERAKHELEVMLDYDAFELQQQIDRDRRDQMRGTFMANEEIKIPWTQEVLYPSNWLTLTNRRTAAGLGVTGETGEGRELNRKLDAVLPEVRFEDQPFEGVVDFLRDTANLNLTVDWEDLSANGIEKDKPVSIRLTNVSFRTALREILTQVGADVTLAYQVSDGLIKIATKEKLDKDKDVRVYDINDLLVNIPRFTNAASLNPAQALNQIGQGSQGGGGQSQLFEDTEQGGEGGAGGEFGEGGGPGNLIQQIQDIIRQTVEPDSWRETGAGDGSLRELNGQLIVYNTSDAHRQVNDLLSQLREFRALQIAVETRFLTVASNFLEEIGVDLDFVFNSGSAGFDQAFNAGGAPLIDPFTGGAILVPRQFNRIGALPNPPGFGNPLINPVTGGTVGAAPTGFAQPWAQPGLVPGDSNMWPTSDEMTPVAARQNSLNLVSPGNFQTGVPGSFADAFRAGAQPAMQIAGSFLDNLQVDFLIRATQANSRSSVAQAPRLILFNGQRANIFVGRAQSYVASLQPQIAQQAAAFAPIIGVAPSGSSLDVEATISADRRYVTVTVRTTRAEDPTLTRFEIQRASGNAPGAFITNVDQRVSTINTTVSIPDGGTVMLGGLKQVGEIEVDAGVPILSKIPVLKRAFTNTTTIKDTQTLLILIKAKIIIQREAEEEAFPTLTTAG